MDTGNGTASERCAEIIYSNEYLNFLVKYENDINGVYESIDPECVNIVNNRFLVAYRSIEGLNLNGAFGYSVIPKCYGLMDMSGVTAIGADRVRDLPGLGLTGQGVLIGFADTGIDYTNALFQNADGTTRIAAIWDQTEEAFGRGNPVFGYGAEFTTQDINRALASDSPFEIVPSRDGDGHGTFLASVAAAGRLEAEDYTGVAPKADIVVVKLKQAKKNLRDFFLVREDAVCFGEDDVMLGIKYMIDKANVLGKPLIICLGIGTAQGDHNGNTTLEQYFASLVNLRGLCVVAAAGNELGYGGHYSGNNRLVTGAREDMEIQVGANERGFAMEIWGGPSGLLKISVLSPTGERLEQIPYNRDGGAQLRFLYEGTVVYVQNLVVERESGDQLVFLRFENPAEGIWTIQVTTMGAVGNGFDAWLPMHDFLSIGSSTAFVQSDPNITICAPANGKGAITVAGYNHYTNALYINSSRGYTRSGAIRPDIAAPAVDIYGAFVAGRQGTMLFTRKSGTSIAAAYTAGAAALIMEWAIVKGNNPFINTEIIRQLMIRGVQHVADTDYPNRSWGWGALDVYGVFELMRNV